MTSQDIGRFWLSTLTGNNIAPVAITCPANSTLNIIPAICRRLDKSIDLSDSIHERFQGQTALAARTRARYLINQHLLSTKHNPSQRDPNVRKLALPPGIEPVPGSVVDWWRRFQKQADL